MARAPGIGVCSVPFNETFCNLAMVFTPLERNAVHRRGLGDRPQADAAVPHHQHGGQSQRLRAAPGHALRNELPFAFTADLLTSRASERTWLRGVPGQGLGVTQPCRGNRPGTNPGKWTAVAPFRRGVSWRVRTPAEKEKHPPDVLHERTRSTSSVCNGEDATPAEAKAESYER
jgi:hypothetical protein